MEKITYEQFKNLLISYASDAPPREKTLTYALYLLNQVESDERLTALGFIQGYLGIIPANF